MAYFTTNHLPPLLQARLGACCKPTYSGRFPEQASEPAASTARHHAVQVVSANGPCCSMEWPSSPQCLQQFFFWKTRKYSRLLAQRQQQYCLTPLFASTLLG